MFLYHDGKTLLSADTRNEIDLFIQIHDRNQNFLAPSVVRSLDILRILYPMYLFMLLFSLGMKVNRLPNLLSNPISSRITFRSLRSILKAETLGMYFQPEPNTPLWRWNLVFKSLFDISYSWVKDLISVFIVFSVVVASELEIVANATLHGSD